MPLTADEQWILGELLGHLDGAVTRSVCGERLIMNVDGFGSIAIDIDRAGANYSVTFGDLAEMSVCLEGASSAYEAADMFGERVGEALAAVVEDLSRAAEYRRRIAEMLAPFTGTTSDSPPLGPPQDGDILTVTGATAYMLLHLADVGPVALGTLIASLPKGAVRLFVHGSSTPPAADIVHPHGRRTVSVKAPHAYYGAVLGSVTAALSNEDGQTWAQILRVERFVESFAVDREKLGCWAPPPALAEKLQTRS